MKTMSTLGIVTAVLFAPLMFISCQKSIEREATVNAVRQSEGPSVESGVTLTAPATVNINQNFNILAEVSCGKVAIERGYVLGPGDVKIYKGLDCNTANLIWEEIVGFECYTTDASWTGSLSEVGTYVYRTKHNGNDGNCDGLGGSNTSGLCSFNGNQFSCFVIEAVNPCQTSFTGEAISCGTTRQAVYRFSSINALSYVKIQGGLTNFTGGDATVSISGGSFTYSQFTPGSSSNRVIVIEGSVAACEEVTITVNWTSTNSGGVITGDWSAKDGNGVEVAPSVAGLSCN